MERGVAIQIIKSENHLLQLEVDALKRILEADSIKDHQVVIVSVAGELRKGKSFLLNFFLKYLYAQYKRHNTWNWIRDTTYGTGLNRFQSVRGVKPVTKGIWIWSEIFTTQNWCGENLAIILMDTQGIYDHESSMNDCTGIFATSMMISSVQCYNIIQNVQENHLQDLELFAAYGQLAMNKSNAKPFQKLLFVVRDWPYQHENDYGDGQEFVNKLLTVEAKQAPEIQQLRRQIKSSFNKIGAFLLPHPGDDFAEGKQITQLSQINEKFMRYVQQLTESIFAPGNLIVKEINGEKLRARDVVSYLQEYVKVFSSEQTPKVESVLMANARVEMHIAYGECLQFYVDSMQIELNREPTYHYDHDLQRIHNKTKTASIKKFDEKSTLGGHNLNSDERRKLVYAIEDKYRLFKQKNEKKMIDRFQDIAGTVAGVVAGGFLAFALRRFR